MTGKSKQTINSKVNTLHSPHCALLPGSTSSDRNLPRVRRPRHALAKVPLIPHRHLRHHVCRPFHLRHTHLADGREGAQKRESYCPIWVCKIFPHCFLEGGRPKMLRVCIGTQTQTWPVKKHFVTWWESLLSPQSLLNTNQSISTVAQSVEIK